MAKISLAQYLKSLSYIYCQERKWGMSLDWRKNRGNAISCLREVISDFGAPSSRFMDSASQECSIYIDPLSCIMTSVSYDVMFGDIGIGLRRHYAD